MGGLCQGVMVSLGEDCFRKENDVRGHDGVKGKAGVRGNDGVRGEGGLCLGGCKSNYV